VKNKFVFHKFFIKLRGVCMIDIKKEIFDGKNGIVLKDGNLNVSRDMWKIELNMSIEDQGGGLNNFDYVVRQKNSKEFFVISELKANARDRLEEISLLSIQSRNVGASRGCVLSRSNFSAAEKMLTDSLSVERIKSLIYGDREMVMIPDTGKLAGYGNIRIKMQGNFQSKRRDKSKIIYNILSLTGQENGAGITKIIYKCNLNYKSAMTILDDMKNKNLVELVKEKSTKSTYVITKEGLKALDDLNRINYYLRTN
jgi:predicted transcriptional regulator